MGDYKQKYEQALDNFKKIKAANKDNKELIDFIEYNYPELKESEDEKIRKELWEYFHNMQLSSDCDFSPSLTMGDILAYLERQKEQKPAWSENVKRMFIKALERVEEQNNKGYKLTDCDKNSWWKDFKTYCGYAEMQKPIWNEKDENGLNDALWAIQQARTIVKDENDMGNLRYAENWLKSLKERVKESEKMKQIELTELADRKAVSILREADGTAAGILIQTFDERFALELHPIDNGRVYNWQDAMGRLVELGRSTYNFKQGHIIAAYHEEIDKALEEAGGKVLGYEWIDGEYNSSAAWYYNSTLGALSRDKKSYNSQVRPLLASTAIEGLLSNNKKGGGAMTNVIEQIKAEIKRQYEETSIGLSEYDAGYENGRAQLCHELLAFIYRLQKEGGIDTLEAKEVDLEKEIDNYLNPIEAWQIQEAPFSSMEKTARHFFELGLKTQKGGEE